MAFSQEITIEEYRALMQKASKYGNKKTFVGVIAFDSVAEAARYKELKLLEAAGDISDLTLQPVYILQEPFIDSEGNKQRAIKYKADFSYTAGPEAVVEEVKGFETAAWRIKKKLFLKRYPEYKLQIIWAGSKKR